MVIKAVKPGIRPAIRPAVKPAAAPAAAPAATTAEEVVTEAVEQEQAVAEETTQAAPAAAPKVAAKPAAAPKAAAAPKVKAPVSLGGEARKFQVELPEELGGRITLDNVQDLYFNYLQAHAEDLGFTVPTKAMASRIMESVFKFLIGDSPEASIEGTPESIIANGGLAVLFEAKLMEGVHFKHTVIENRRYRNPRSDSAENAYVRVQGRRSIGMTLTVDEGQTTYEAE